MSSSAERRQYERLNKIIGIEYLSNEGEKNFSMTLDISLSGIAFLTKDPIKVGNPLEVQLLREVKETPITLKGKVVRCLEQNSGCIIAGEFLPLDSVEKKNLQTFIEEYRN